VNWSPTETVASVGLIAANFAVWVAVFSGLLAP